MKIAYASPYDPTDIHNWSGLGYYIAKSLSCFAELQYINNLNYKTSTYQKLQRQYWKMRRKSYDYGRLKAVGVQYANQIESKIQNNVDLLFSPSTQQIAYYSGSIPKVFYGDATFASLLDFYPEFCNLSPETIRQGHEMEKYALDTCSLAIYSSKWAADSALKDYNAESSKVHIVPFGANIESKRTLNDIKYFAESKPNICNLLFIGVDWVRKGGSLAVEIATELNILGVPTLLHIVGIKNDDISNLPDFVINHGFISKSTKEGKEYLDDLFQKSHFLLVPSIAEAYGLVFCEANSFGVPCLSTNIGGIPTIIKDNLNGFTFSKEDRSEKYIDKILPLLENRESYLDLAQSSYNEYVTRLNWDVVSKSIKNLLEQI